MSRRASVLLALPVLAFWALGGSVRAECGIRVESEPPCLEVTLNGKSAGSTPLARLVNPGPIEVSAGGCAVSVEVADGALAEFAFREEGGGAWKAGPARMGKMPKIFLDYSRGTGGLLGCRFRRTTPTENGVDPAFRNALRWLARHQSADGRWSAKCFRERCQGPACDGPGSDDAYDPGVTGLALLAFLGAGESMTAGEHAGTVRRGFEYLAGILDREGIFGGPNMSGSFVYAHSIATLAALEASEMDGSAILREAARAGVNFLLRAQNPGQGWRYGVRPGDNDTSVTGWALHVLVIARYLGHEVPFEAVLGGLRWFERVTDDTFGKVGYTSKGDTGARLPEAMGKFQPTEGMTAFALFDQLLIGRRGEDPLFRAGIGIVLDRPPVWGTKNSTTDFYYWLHATKALHLYGGNDKAPPDRRQAWKKWRSTLVDTLLPGQRPKSPDGAGDAEGSFDPIDAWGTAGGRVWSTAAGALMLEVPWLYPDWASVLDGKRSFLRDFEERIERGELLSVYVNPDRAKQAPGDTLFLVVNALETRRKDPKKEGAGWEHLLARHVVGFPSRKAVDTSRRSLQAEVFQDLKRQGVHLRVDAGGFSDYAPEAARRFLVSKGILKNASSWTLAGTIRGN